jgi:hypothetical protein
MSMHLPVVHLVIFGQAHLLSKVVMGLSMPSFV